MLTITDLPGDILDHISAFLPDRDLARFLCASRQITVSAYLLRDRQRAHWKKCGAEHLAKKGDLQGLQYLHSVDVVVGTDYAMNWAVINGVINGDFAMVEFLHSIGVRCTDDAMNFAAENGYLAMVQYLHSIGGSFTTYAMDFAAENGHLAVVEFLHSIGVRCTENAMVWAAKNEHMAMVEYLQTIKQ